VGLTARQLEAVAVEKIARDTCVVAGPGSGKTAVLVKYFERLVDTGTDPLRILAITFTEKAARSMQEKLKRAFQDQAHIRGRLERAYVSTVHAYCAGLLRENAIFAGIDPDFHVMDEREAARPRREAVDDALDTMFAAHPERMRGLMRVLLSADTGAAILDVYDAIRAAAVNFDELERFPAPAAVDLSAALESLRGTAPADWKFEQQAYLIDVQDWGRRIAAASNYGAKPILAAMQSFVCNLQKLKRGNPMYDGVKSFRDDSLPKLEYQLITECYAAERATIFALLGRFDDLYRKRKQQSGGLDYDDLEEYAVGLLEENPDVRRRVQGQFDHVLMDEYQDTNGRQAKLLDLVRPPGRFYAVGDINQSIYGFRHAEPREFHEYRDTVLRGGQRLVELVENFRSRPDILHVVESILDGAAGIEARPLVPGKQFPDKADPSVEILAAVADDIDTALQWEAQWVAARILELEGRLAVHDHAAEFRDFAVLVRNSEVMNEFARAFDELGIPYVLNRGKGFYEGREVLDLMALLKVLVNPRDEIAMAAVLRSPFVGVSDEALLRLRLLGNIGAAVEPLSPDALAAFTAGDAAKLACFRDQLARWRASRDYVPIDQLLAHAMDECGYESPAGPRGAANIEKLLGQARAAGARQSLAEFVEDLELLRASKPREPDAPPEDSANAVKVMTVHAAKGLEFPVVFVAAVHKGIESGPDAIAFSPRIGLGARWRHPMVAGKDKDDAFQHAIREELKQREEEEGHRLLYVAMTRAEEHLVLSFSNDGKKLQNWAALIASRLHLDLTTARNQTGIITAPRGEQVPVGVTCIRTAPGRGGRRNSGESILPVQPLARPTIAEQYDTQANVTSIALFADCPRHYYLSRYLGFETPSRATGDEDGESQSDLGASDFGKQVHALLAGAAVDSPDPEALRLAEAFGRSALGRRADRAAVEREFDFLMEVENVVLRGQIDLWFEDGGGTVLVDFKTDRVDAACAQARAEKYGLQLRLYALALERLKGRAPKEAYVYFLRPNVAVPVDLRPSLFNAPEPVVRAFREAQERSHFPLNEGQQCRYCPHFGGLCPAVAAPQNSPGTSDQVSQR